MHGIVVDGNGDDVVGALITFIPADCDTCPSTGAVSDSDGYQKDIAAGRYQVSCAVVGATCQFGNGRDTVLISVPATSELDLVVSGTGAPSTAAAPGATNPARTSAAECAAEGFDVCGRVTFDGKPATGVEIELQCIGACNVHASVNQNGYYGIQADAGSYTAVCVVTDHPELNCAPVSGPEPVVVSIPPHGQIVDWIVTRV